MVRLIASDVAARVGISSYIKMCQQPPRKEAGMNDTRIAEIQMRQHQMREIDGAIQRIQREREYKQQNVDRARLRYNEIAAELKRAEKELAKAQRELDDMDAGVHALHQLAERLHGEILLLGGNVERDDDDDEDVS